MIFQLIKFFAVGAIATLIQYVVLWALVESELCSVVLASSAGFVLSALFNYLLNYYITFASGSSHQLALVKFVTVATIALGINALLIGLLHNWLGFHYLIAQLFTTAVVFCFNFLAHRHWTYQVNLV